MVDDPDHVIRKGVGDEISNRDGLFDDSPFVVFIQVVPGVGPVVCFVQDDLFVDLAVTQQLNGNTNRAQGVAAVVPDLVNGQLFGFIAFGQKYPVYFADTVCVLVAEFNGNVKLHAQVQGFAAVQSAEQNILCQHAFAVELGFILGSRTCFIDQLTAVVDAHRQLGQEVLHACDGLVTGIVGNDFLLILAIFVFKRFAVSQGVLDFVVNVRAHIDLDVIAVICAVCQGDFFRQLVAGHDVLEVVKEVGCRVHAAGLEFKAFLQTPEGDGCIRRECGDCHAHHHRQDEEQDGGFPE